jgi:hypothetical protein
VKKLGAEAILSAILLPFVVWIVSNMYELKSAYAEVKQKNDYNKEMLLEIKQNVEYIRQKMEAK